MIEMPRRIARLKTARRRATGGRWATFWSACLATCCFGPWAQAGSALGILVPRTDATCGPGNIMHAPECDYEFVCYRTDSLASMVNPGEETQRIGAPHNCITCALCCTDVKTYCIGQVCVTLTRTFNFSIAPQITFGIPGISAGLTAGFNWGSQTANTFCASAGSAEFPPCMRCAWRAMVTVYEGQQWAITHSYSWYTRLRSGPPSCGGYGGEERLLNNCSSTQTSTVTSDAWGAMWVEAVGCNPCR